MQLIIHTTHLQFTTQVCHFSIEREGYLRRDRWRGTTSTYSGSFYEVWDHFSSGTLHAPARPDRSAQQESPHSCAGETSPYGHSPPVRKSASGPGRCVPAMRVSLRKNSRNSVGIFQEAIPALRNGVLRRIPDSQTVRIVVDDASANQYIRPSGAAAILLLSPGGDTRRNSP